MQKSIIFDKEARKKLKSGIDQLADAVKVTLGPKGNDVVIAEYHSNGKPHITKDGVTVAKSIELSDPVEEAGVHIIREAALKTVSTCGDSTTTSIVLSQALVDQADIVLQEHPTISPVMLKKEIEDIVPVIRAEIQKRIIPINESDIEHIATISANNDSEIGKLIGDAYKEIGRDGIVLVEESKSVKTYNEIIMGMQFENGYIANHFVTDPVKDQCILQNPYILVTEQKIMNTRDLLNILNPIAQDKKSILLIAQDFDDAVIENFKLNHLQGIIKCCLVKAPSYGIYRKGLLQDIAALTTASCLTYDSGCVLSDMDFSWLGACEKVIVTKDRTTIIKGAASMDDVKKYTEALKVKLDTLQKDPAMIGSFDEKFLKERIARLLGGICTIHVGGTTELEMKERMDRIDDAACAVKAALQSGVVRGGGITYRDIVSACAKRFANTGGTAGQCIVFEALMAPWKTLLYNAGIIPDESEEPLENSGYDLNTGNWYADVYEASIIDPALACMEAFENAISVLRLYLSSSCVVSPQYSTIPF